MKRALVEGHDPVFRVSSDFGGRPAARAGLGIDCRCGCCNDTTRYDTIRYGSCDDTILDAAAATILYSMRYDMILDLAAVVFCGPVASISTQTIYPHSYDNDFPLLILHSTVPENLLGPALGDALVPLLGSGIENWSF